MRYVYTNNFDCMILSNGPNRVKVLVQYPQPVLRR